MKKLIVLLFVCVSFVTMAQNITILKPVTFADTTISKCFVKYDYSYGMDKKITINLTAFNSKSALRKGNAVYIPEISAGLTIDMSADQSETLTQLNNMVQTAIRQELKRVNTTWTNSDIVF